MWVQEVKRVNHQSYQLDKIDRNIVRLLQQDARMPHTELARKVGLSTTPCKERVRRLEREGVIQHYQAVLNPSALDRGLVVFVQVTNPARQPMRLTKLEYRFAAGRTTVSEGELELAREVPAGEAVVVEVPILAAAGEAPLTLIGKLTAVTDQIVRIFHVSAEVAPAK